MSEMTVCGIGAVSPAGWNVEALRCVLVNRDPLRITPVKRPGWCEPLEVRTVPAPAVRPVFLSHSRFRRTSPISQFAVAAGIEALGNDLPKIQAGEMSLGIVVSVLSACVNFSRRFYDETWRNPATASPLVFPETVFNAPSSHIAAWLGTEAINYTIVGDQGMFLVALAIAADWLEQERVQACLVIGAEESDWITADAFRLFARRAILSEGAGAIYLKRDGSNPIAILSSITDAHAFLQDRGKLAAVQAMRAQLPPFCAAHLLCDSRIGLDHYDAPEQRAWDDWSGEKLSPKTLLGEGLAASSAWQCVSAIDRLQNGRYTAASISVVGCNQQAIGAHFVRPTL
ncbi:MAG: hypothetical protein AB1813_23995 [Verrucomicrobiota bacterium]